MQITFKKPLCSGTQNQAREGIQMQKSVCPEPDCTLSQHRSVRAASRTSVAGTRRVSGRLCSDGGAEESATIASFLAASTNAVFRTAGQK